MGLENSGRENSTTNHGTENRKNHYRLLDDNKSFHIKGETAIFDYQQERTSCHIDFQIAGFIKASLGRKKCNFSGKMIFWSLFFPAIDGTVIKLENFGCP